MDRLMDDISCLFCSTSSCMHYFASNVLPRRIHRSNFKILAALRAVNLISLPRMMCLQNFAEQPAGGIPGSFA
jgi:hypothetical protein